jgi:hypothetical protein
MANVWLRKAIAVGGVLLLANAVFAVLGPHLPDPVVYPTREIQLGVDRIDARAADGCVDLLVSGNSVAAAALSAQRLAERLGLDEGVVGVLGGSIASVDVDWMRRVTIPRTQPGTVVYVASPVMFFPDDVAEQYGLRIYERSVALRGGWPGSLQRWAVDNIPLIRYRSDIADPETLVDAVTGEIPTDVVTQAPGFTVEPDGHLASTVRWSGDQTWLATLKEAVDAVGTSWRVDLDQQATLRQWFDELDRRGMDVIEVIPPVTDDLRANFPDGPEGFETYLEAARGVVDGTSASLVDLSELPYPDDLFFDTHHLNEEGSRRLTDDVVAALGDQQFTSCDDVTPRTS